MPKLTDISYVKKLMEDNGLTFLKKYGQNFLQDVKIPRRIAMECTNFTFPEGDTIPDEKADSLILEIGPGAGILTKELAKRFKKVVAVEIDTSLEGVLKDSLEGYDNVEVVFSDIMDIDLVPFLAQKRKREDGSLMPVSVCANLPYYITTPILMKLIESKLPFDSITVMVQTEVAERLSAGAGKKNCGAITAAIDYYGDAKMLFTVSADRFMPPPKVNSSVVRIDLWKDKPVKPIDEELFFKTIKAAFEQRRKTLPNALAAGFGELDKQTLTDVIVSCGHSADVRGERLSIEEFVALSDAIYEKIHA